MITQFDKRDFSCAEWVSVDPQDEKIALRYGYGYGARTVIFNTLTSVKTAISETTFTEGVLIEWFGVVVTQDQIRASR
jgi:hypothetical protein